MSAATASSTETIFVRLLGEGVDVWRPVLATPLADGSFRLDDAAPPAGETWEFEPGALVRTDTRVAEDGSIRIAKAHARSAPARRAG